MSKLLGELGGILEKYGFPVGDSGNDVWGRKSLLQQGQYQGTIGWPPSLLNPLKQYLPLCKEYVRGYLGLQKAKHDKEVAIGHRQSVTENVFTASDLPAAAAGASEPSWP